MAARIDQDDTRPGDEQIDDNVLASRPDFSLGLSLNTPREQCHSTQTLDVTDLPHGDANTASASPNLTLSVVTTPHVEVLETEGSSAP